jgi:DNA-directed RNA polymerase specialized sigma subunit
MNTNQISNEDLIREYQLSTNQYKEEILTEIIEKNLGLIKKIMQRFEIDPNEYEDMLQISKIATVKAVETFKFEKKCLFSTHLKQHIEGKIKREIENKSNLPSYLYQLQARINKLKNSPETKNLIENASEREEVILTKLILKENLEKRKVERIIKTEFTSSTPEKIKEMINELKEKTIEEIIEETKHPLFKKYQNRISKLLNINTSTVSLNSKINNDGSKEIEMIDMIQDSSPSIEDQVIEMDLLKNFKATMSTLPEKERDIIRQLMFESELNKKSKKKTKKTIKTIEIIREKLRLLVA